MDKNNFRTRVTPKNKKTNLSINPEIWKRFQIFAALKKIGVSEYVMQLIDKELKDKKEEFEKLSRENRIKNENAIRKINEKKPKKNNWI